ncbi:pyroglutamyl-peptidase I [Lacticaseibacillus saniviri]|nr:pyroglutamyl-peptidase I [Lacticaseibacillus saniviri]MCG4281168.1 pyroglutamyl-peptidase I [Lacticaseibacillus saniviri]
MKILVTGFDPFGGATINPALEVVKRLPEQLDGATIIKLEVPTVFSAMMPLMQEAIAKSQPDVVLHIGQAGGRNAVTIERVAINLDDARIPDNRGDQPVDEPIATTGDSAYFTQLPLKAIVQAIRKAGVPAQVSNSAGTFVCNHLMYVSQFIRAKDYPTLKAGFIHIPYLPEQAPDKQPSLTLDQDLIAITAALRTIIAYDQRPDIKTIEGALN